MKGEATCAAVITRPFLLTFLSGSGRILRLFIEKYRGRPQRVGRHESPGETRIALFDPALLYRPPPGFKDLLNLAYQFHSPVIGLHVGLENGWKPLSNDRFNLFAFQGKKAGANQSAHQNYIR